MIAIDTNILVYAHRSDSPWHERAISALERVSLGIWAIPWPCIHEFLAVATHPRIFDPATPLEEAVAAVESWLRSATLRVLGVSEEHWAILVDTLREGRIVGPRVHDARIAALCLEHGVSELWSADRDFGRFPALRVRNPLVTH